MHYPDLNENNLNKEKKYFDKIQITINKMQIEINDLKQKIELHLLDSQIDKKSYDKYY